MIICFPIEKNNGLESELDARFGRAAGFLYYDTETKGFTVDENTFLNESHGVGIKISTAVVNHNTKVVIGAQPGPKAVDILQKGGIKLIQASNITVAQTLETYSKDLEIE